jgi:hypothetical protein
VEVQDQRSRYVRRDRTRVNRGLAAHRAQAADKERAVDLSRGVWIGEPRREWPDCIADAQCMANAWAGLITSPERNLTSDPRDASTARLTPAPNRHANCSSGAEEDHRRRAVPSTVTPPSPNRRDPQIHRGAQPRPIPSSPIDAPDCRDFDGDEWRVRKPTRRDSQCVQL